MKKTKQEIVDTLNRSNLSMYIIESILKDLYSEVRLEISNHLIKDVESYENMLEEKINH